MEQPEQPPQELLDWLREQYLDVRVLEDGTIAALGQLMFTKAIHLGLARFGFERRFCFENQALAVQRFAELKSCEDIPEGFTARRGL